MAFKAREAQKTQTPHVFIATPAYDGKVESDYAQSLAETSFCCPLYGIKVTMMVTGNGAFIDLARNIFVKKFLEQEDFKECTHLFFIDADLKFEARAFMGLVLSGLPICAGIYPRRQEPLDFPCVYSENPDGGGLWFDNDWLQAKRVPTGFLCISRQVLKEMSEDAQKIHVHGQDGPVPWVFHTKFDEHDPPRFVGEDYGFCDDYVAKYKKPIPVWANFTFTHGRMYTGNLFEHLTEKKKEREEQQSSAA